MFISYTNIKAKLVIWVICGLEEGGGQQSLGQWYKL